MQKVSIYPSQRRAIALTLSLTAGLALGCGEASQVQKTAPDNAAPPPATATMALIPGTYCFRAIANTSDGSVDEALTLTVMSDGRVSGYLDAADGETFTGTLSGSSLQFDPQGIFDSDGSTPIVWQVQANQLNNGSFAYDAVNCDTVQNRFPAGGTPRTVSAPGNVADTAALPTLQGSTATPSHTAPPIQPSAADPSGAARPDTVQRFRPQDLSGGPTASDVVPEWIKNFRTIPVQFARNSDRAAMDSFINDDEAHSYELRARAGQVMEVEITSPEGLAFMSIFAPSGVLMVREPNGPVTLELPLDGVYFIGVYSYYATVPYTLTVRIR